MKHNEICHCDKNEHASWTDSRNNESIKSSSRESFTNSELKSFRFVASAKISWQPTAPSLHQPVTAIGFSTETKRRKSADPSGSEEEHEVLSSSRSCHVVKSHDSSFWKIEKSFSSLYIKCLKSIWAPDRDSCSEDGRAHAKTRPASYLDQWTPDARMVENINDNLFDSWECSTEKICWEQKKQLVHFIPSKFKNL